jgi:hypothetical protein
MAWLLDTNIIITQVATLTRLESEVKATGEDKESHFEFEPGGGDGVNMLGQQALNEAACGFYRFAGCGHQVMDGRVQATFRIFFLARQT